ncbi:MAG: hypothetical protein VW235_03820, partial [Rhodospirillaceae bacterium]
PHKLVAKLSLPQPEVKSGRMGKTGNQSINQFCHYKLRKFDVPVDETTNHYRPGDLLGRLVNKNPELIFPQNVHLSM